MFSIGWRDLSASLDTDMRISVLTKTVQYCRNEDNCICKNDWTLSFIIQRNGDTVKHDEKCQIFDISYMDKSNFWHGCATLVIWLGFFWAVLKFYP